MKADKAVMINVFNNGNDMAIEFMNSEGYSVTLDKFNTIDRITRNALIVYNLDIEYAENIRGRRNIAASAQLVHKEITKRALTTLQGNEQMITYTVQLALISYAQHHRNEVKQNIKNYYLKNFLNKGNKLDDMIKQDIKDMFSIIDSDFPIAYTQIHLDTIVSDQLIEIIMDTIGWKKKDNNQEHRKTYGFFPL